VKPHASCSRVNSQSDKAKGLGHFASRIQGWVVVAGSRMVARTCEALEAVLARKLLWSLAALLCRPHGG
jgi:hypothetical protein